VYVISGAAGTNNSPNTLHTRDEDVDVGPGGPSIAVYSASKSYTMLTAYNATHLEFNQIEASKNTALDTW